MELTDAYVAQVELRTRRRTEELVHGLFPFEPKPKVDRVGVNRLGWGRPVDSRGQSERVASMALTEEIMATQNVLHNRVVDLLAHQSGAETRLPYLYAAADILGAVVVRDWKELWDAAKRGDWSGVASELLVADWDNRYGREVHDRRAVTKLVLGLAHAPGHA